MDMNKVKSHYVSDDQDKPKPISKQDTKNLLCSDLYITV